MKQALQLRVSQHLALTPQLQQAIRLLQLSTLELNAEIEQALHDNPMLERIEAGDPGCSPGQSGDLVAPEAMASPENERNDDADSPFEGLSD